MKHSWLLVFFWVWAGLSSTATALNTVRHPQLFPVGLIMVMAGEPGPESILFQARVPADWLEASPELEVEFQFSTDSTLDQDLMRSPALRIRPGQNGIVKHRQEGLKPGTWYWYRCHVVKPRGYSLTGSRKGRFRTLPARLNDSLQVLVSSCMHLEKFLYGPKMDGKGAKGTVQELEGFPALEAMFRLKPDFWILNGDNVYYDHSFPPDSTWTNRAKSKDQMAEKWRQLFDMQNLRRMIRSTGTFWLKDDHDFRYDDADRSDTNRYSDRAWYMPEPSPADGISVFREQVPVTFPADKGETYRTFAIGESAQFWLLEGRDFRDPKYQAPGPTKSIWGTKQKEWLKQTLKESKATFRIVVSPPPLIAPDEEKKSDNHANPLGYADEAREFFGFLKEAGLDPRKTLLICGDRHWQYQSQHPDGYIEVCSGALNKENARTGVGPGNPRSTDPEAKIKQAFRSDEIQGGFLHLSLFPNQLRLRFVGENGAIRHQLVLP